MPEVTLNVELQIANYPQFNDLLEAKLAEAGATEKLSTINLHLTTEQAMAIYEQLGSIAGATDIVLNTSLVDVVAT